MRSIEDPGSKIPPESLHTGVRAHSEETEEYSSDNNPDQAAAIRFTIHYSFQEEETVATCQFAFPSIYLSIYLSANPSHLSIHLQYLHVGMYM